MLVDQITTLGHSVVALANTGRDAVRATVAERPDVVLLDIHMPDGSGVDAATEIAHSAPGVGVVLFTGDEHYALTAVEASATAAICFLPKPAPRTLLESTLRL